MNNNRAYDNQQSTMRQMPVGIAPHFPAPPFTFPQNIRTNPYRNNNPAPISLQRGEDEPPSYEELYPNASYASQPNTNERELFLNPPARRTNIPDRVSVRLVNLMVENPPLSNTSAFLNHQNSGTIIPNRSPFVPGTHNIRTSGYQPNINQLQPLLYPPANSNNILEDTLVTPYPPTSRGVTSPPYPLLYRQNLTNGSFMPQATRPTYNQSTIYNEPFLYPQASGSNILGASVTPYTPYTPYTPNPPYPSSTRISPYPYPNGASVSQRSSVGTNLQTNSRLSFPLPIGISEPGRSSFIPSTQTSRTASRMPFPLPMGINGPETASLQPIPRSGEIPRSTLPYETNNLVSSNLNQSIGYSISETGSPTIRPKDNFNPQEDARALERAFTCRQINKMGIINILCRRTLMQRIIIEDIYNQQNEVSLNESFIENIKSGNFRCLMLSLLKPLDKSNVENLHNAIERNDYNVVPEILCTISNKEIQNLKNHYFKAFRKSLELHITEKAINLTQGIMKLLLEICKCNRDESQRTDLIEAKNIATRIFSTREVHQYFLQIFGTTNFKQIKLICEQYEKLYGCSIDTKIKKDFILCDMQAYLVIARFVRNKHEFYAKRLHQSMKGLGTNNIQLMRIIVLRSEIDLQDIKEAFQRMFGESLKRWIEDDTSGHFRIALIELLGENYH